MATYLLVAGAMILSFLIGGIVTNALCKRSHNVTARAMLAHLETLLNSKRSISEAIEIQKAIEETKELFL